jgi:hypothetical protein
VADIADSESRRKSLEYAVSTLYYAVSGVLSGGSKSEQVGDVKVTVSGGSFTRSDRNALRRMADGIRSKLGCETEYDPDSDNGIFDATPLMKGRRWSI